MIDVIVGSGVEGWRGARDKNTLSGGDPLARQPIQTTAEVVLFPHRYGTRLTRRKSIVLFTLTAALVPVGMFLGMLLMFEVGRRGGHALLSRDPNAMEHTGTVEGAVFGLFGLLVAFTFSGAALRFEARRHLIVEEANAIGTAYLRIDLLPHESQPGVRQLFRQISARASRRMKTSTTSPRPRRRLPNRWRCKARSGRLRWGRASSRGCRCPRRTCCSPPSTP